ncbi:MAG: hypothetical protein WKF77_31565 [Planctomycetaceae bacterium]
MFNSSPQFPNNPVLTRRAALQRSAVGFGSLAMASMLAERSVVAGPGSMNSVVAPLPHHPARRAIIFLFMSGGPSQVDTLIQNRC